MVVLALLTIAVSFTTTGFTIFGRAFAPLLTRSPWRVRDSAPILDRRFSTIATVAVLAITGLALTIVLGVKTFLPMSVVLTSLTTAAVLVGLALVFAYAVQRTHLARDHAPMADVFTLTASTKVKTGGRVRSHAPIATASPAAIC
ncbi:MAG: hypothetical protein HY443_02060 [Candidatus Nealsonbacteria bacterium]|nr:hypothetical protein [Candidatus Nealsonbacteria bacterium]